MSLLERKDAIHIGIECVVIGCLGFYFNNKNKNLQQQIDTLQENLRSANDRIVRLHNEVLRLSTERRQKESKDGNIQQELLRIHEKIFELSTKLSLDKKRPTAVAPQPQPQPTAPPHLVTPLHEPEILINIQPPLSTAEYLAQLQSQVRKSDVKIEEMAGDDDDIDDLTEERAELNGSIKDV